MIVYPLNPLVKAIIGLSKDEDAVFEAVRTVQMHARSVQIARKAGIDRQQTNRILKTFQERSIVLLYRRAGHHDHWRYNRKIDRLHLQLLDLSEIIACVEEMGLKC